MMLNDLWEYWKSDYRRYFNYGAKRLTILLLTPGFIYCFYMRLCKYLKVSKYHVPLYPFYLLFRIVLIHYEYKFGIQIPYITKIGYGLYIGHFGTIVVHPQSVIGNNVNLSQGITIGLKGSGVPTIGNDVYLGPGAKVIGHIKIGNNAAIGANCVVTKDVQDNAIVVGVPGRVISLRGNRNPAAIVQI
jgi:serine O-acetyltransferase